MLLVMALLAAQATDGEVAVKAVPRGTAPWITNDDYPVEEARQHHEGLVGVTLQIDVSGRATKCDVTASSGYPGLDNGACFLLMRRARFDPARDAGGNLVASTYAGRFSWRLGNAKPTRTGADGTAGSEAPPPPGMLELAVAALPSAHQQPAKAEIRFGPDHRVSECRIEESSGSAAADKVACAQVRSLADAGPTSKTETAEYIVSFRAEPATRP